MNFNQIISVSLTLFAVIDIIGGLPVLIGLKKKVGNINPIKVTIASGILMLGFLFIGDKLLHFLGVDISSFAIAGSIVMFILGLELVLGIDIFRSEPDTNTSSVIPIAFQLIAGSGTLTTILSLKSTYGSLEIVLGIILNLIVVYLVLISMNWIERKIGNAGIIIIRKFFGVILLAIAIKIFKANIAL
ncbi:MAG: MarC family protein [Bacteroidia bacterium]|nr:MarC family protein [Bacteroidia bacterium]